MWWFTKKKKVLLITVSSATTCTLCKISATACVSECLCKKTVKMEKGIQQTNYNK